MKKPHKSANILRSSIAALIAVGAIQTQARAASGAWNVDANGNWSATGSWLPAAVPGTAAGDVVDLLFNITAARTVTIDTTSRTVGDLNIGDPTATLFGYTLASSAGTVVLNLDGTGTTAATVDFRTNIGNTISAPLTLVDNAVFRSNVAGVQTLSGILSGTGKTVTFNNDTDGTVNAATALNGQFLVTGANTYTGGTTISDVRVTIQTNNTALGAAGSAVTIPNGGQFFNSSGLQNINYAFSIAGNGWVETAAGQPFGALRLEGGAIVTGNVSMTADAGIGGNGTGTVNGIISGGFALSKRGTGTTILGGANTFSGGMVIGNGAFQLNNNAAAGTGAISLVTGGATNATRLLVNGGVTAPNNISFGNVFGIAGQGVLQQTGTGLGTLNGTINITGGPTAGGHFVGGGVATNALVLNGAISSTVALNHRDGFVRYGGGGTGYTALTVTGTAQVGATDGISTVAAVTLGGSQSATLDLNGFNQTLASVSVGNAGNPFSGTVNLGAQTLTLNGDFTAVTSTGLSRHAINATAGGTLNFGATPRNLVVNDNPAVDDLSIVGATVSGAGGVTKTGPGTLALNGATFSAPLTVSTGAIQIGQLTSVGSATMASVNFATGTTLLMKAGASNDLLTVTDLGGFVNSGTTNLVVNQLGGILANGLYPLINYAGTSPGTGSFNLIVGHATATLDDTAGVISLSVTGNDRVIWDGTASTAWATGVTGNWKLATPLTPTDYIESDDVVFQDAPTNNTVAIAANVSPSKVTFTNTTATAYTLSGARGIIGTAALTKTGDGVVTLGTPNEYSGATTISAGTLNLTGSLRGSNITVATGATLTATGSIAGAGVTLTTDGTITLAPTAANTYTGATTINAGTLTADFTSAAALAAASPVSVAGGATLRLQHSGGVFNLATPLSGSGLVIIDPSTTTAGNRDIANVTWNASAFSGTLRLAPTTGTMRIAVDTPNDVGTGPIDIATGGQMFVTAANLTFPNDITISGTGYSEGAGTLGAIRANNPTTFTGAITVFGAAKIGALGGTAIIANTISGGTLTFGGSINNAGGETLAITGDASGLTGIIVNDGSATSNATSIAVNVGNNTASGTIGTVPVSLLADGFKNSVIRFDRTDGYTLGASVTSISAAANHVRTFVDADSQGTGFSDNGLAINLGGSLSTTGGQFRIGQNRANSTANISGALTAGIFSVGANQIGATANLNSGAVVNVGTARLGLGGAVNANSTLNLNNASSLTASYVTLGEVSGGIGVVNQAAGSTVNIDTQLRVGHFPNNTSVYNMAGGTLTMTGVSPNNSPSTAGGGGNGTNGDNNLNTLATAALVGGGIYLGVDGTGVLNHTDGTVTTNWIVLDNRVANGAGANMPDGIDRYNLSGATSILNLRSNWGLIGRNEGSYAVSFGGGTVRVDNTGTGTGTGANITIPLDATIDTAASTTTTLDTNGAGNGFTLTKDVRGTGTLALTGGGTVNLSTATVQNISAALTGTVSLNKAGTGATTLGGNLSGYTGDVTVTAGLLTVPTNLGAGTITVADNAAINGEPILVSALSLGSATGSTIYFNPNTGGALTTGTLTVAGVNNIDLAAIPSGVGPYTVISYGSKLGAGAFQAANPTSYRSAPTIDDTTGNMVTINYTGQKSLTWTGGASTAWNINSAINWNDTTPAPDVFFNLDTVTFPEGGANPSIALTGNLAPAAINVTSATTNYTFTSSAGNQIVGATGITKTGGSTLTLVGPNTHFGVTSIGGGIVSVAAATSLGSGVPGNSIALSGGGRLALTATMDLGVNRSIAVGAGGGNVTMANAAAQTITISGNISGSDALAFESTLAGGGTFALSGNSSGYSGAIAVNSISTGLSTLRLDNQQAVPTSGSITVNFPPAGANLNATTLSLLGNLNMPVGTTLNFTSSLATAVISLRSGIATTNNSTVVFNGPITLSGSSIVQFNAAPGATMTYNAPVTESAPGAFTEGIIAFSNVFFLRGTGTHNVNATITLPSLGSTVAVTDGATAIMNVSGNDYRSANSAFGTLRLGVNDALPTTARLVIGQAGDQATTFDMNGLNQTVSGLEWQAPTGNLLTKGISNSHPTNTSTFTLIQATAPLANFNGTISGRVNFVKDGVATTTLVAPASTFTGNVTVNAGTLAVTGLGAAAGGNGTLGASNVVGKTITVNSTGTLSFGTNNIFGNGVANANLPAVIIDGGTLTSTRYNVLGPLTLNGATLTQSATDGPGSYEGYQFRGNVTVGGSAASTISTGNGKANHLNAITTFNVANATGDANADLTVSAPLRNQSGDFALASGSLNKIGAGTMALTAVNPFTGGVTVDGGTLNVNADAALGAVAGPVAINNNAIVQASGTVTTAARTVTLGVGGGTIDTNGNDVTLNAGSTVTGTTLTKTGLGKLILAGTQTYSTLDTEDGRTDIASSLGTGTSSIIANAETNSSVSQTLASLSIGDGAVFTLGAPLPPAPFAAGEDPGFAADFGGELAGAPVQGVPEPGSAALLFGGMLTLIGIRRRR